MTDRNVTPSPAPDKPLLNTEQTPVRAQNETSPPSGYSRAEAAELKFYVQQVYHIVKPVIACIILSVLWVKISLMGSDFRPARPSFSVYEEKSTDTTGDRLAGSLQNALIMIGAIIGATILFVALFKLGCHKVLYGYLLFTVIILLGFVGYLLMLNFIQVYAIPFDWVTLLFGLLNFSAGGLVVIFWRGPLWLQQAYLVIMSSMMAFALNGLEAWTTWLLLGALAIWDLVAVLCPYGPLRILVNTSREQQREIPALLYSVGMIWVTMVDHQKSEPIPMSPLSPKDAQPGETESMPGSIDEPVTQVNASGNHQKTASSSQLIPQQKRQSSLPAQQANETSRRAPDERGASPEIEDDESGTERGGLKLGLGDFIFYSVLISRTAMEDWVTTVACFIAVMTGLTATIFLLAIYKKALPALPISIAFGILFYFISSFMLSPYMNVLATTGIVV